jgi:hypothetical protein
MKMRALLVTVLLLGGVTAFGANVEDYQQRVTRAAILAEDLAKTGRNDADAISEIRRILPASETVEWQGGSVETDNRWLVSELDAFIDESNAAERRRRMTGIFERLTAIAETMDNIKRAEAAGATKDENKQKIGEILRRPEYQKPAPEEESLFQRWYRKLMEWLREKFPDAPEVSKPGASDFAGLRLVLQVLIYAAVIGLVAFLIFKFGPAIAKRFGWQRKEKRSDRVILGERVAADETSENLFGEAERLAREGRLRDAIRKGYIAALCELSDRNIVRLARHKTNRDYLRDVRKTRAGILESMSGLTGTYERNWYGLRASETADWEDFRERYRQTIAGV